MKYEDLITLVKDPELVKADQVPDLKELVNSYPYFVPARLFYIKALKLSNSLHFAANLKLASMYSIDRRWLYYYIHPDKKLSLEPYKKEKNGKSSGDYFDMMNVVESQGGDTNQTLKNLAERLKSARKMVIFTKKDESDNIVNVEIGKKNNSILKTEKVESLLIPEVKEISESIAKKLIHERRYKEAIEILKDLNLNNPKKSVYFADQIRFLEKVISNSKK